MTQENEQPTVDPTAQPTNTGDDREVVETPENENTGDNSESRSGENTDD